MTYAPLDEEPISNDILVVPPSQDLMNSRIRKSKLSGELGYARPGSVELLNFGIAIWLGRVGWRQPLRCGRIEQSKGVGYSLIQIG
jgi:hypothetical protein